MSVPAFNRHGVWAIYRFEMARFLRTILQSVLTPVITTALFVIVFGSAIGSRMSEVGGVSYGAFIVPGLIMLSLFTESIANASFGIHFPKFTGTTSRSFPRRSRLSRSSSATSAPRRRSPCCSA